MTDKEYFDFMVDVFSKAPSVVIHYPEALYRIAMGMGVAPSKVSSWVYNSNLPRQHRDIAYFNVMPDFSLVVDPYKNPTDKRIKALMAAGSLGRRSYDWFYVDQVKNVSKTGKTESHPCQMPEEVMGRVVGVIPRGKTVIDPFCGTGTTGVACRKLGVPFIGIDMDPKYVEISRSRISESPVGSWSDGRIGWGD